MKIGDRLVLAFWLAGDETQEQIRQFEQDCREAFQADADKAGFLVGPVEFTVKLPGEPQVPDTPKWLDQRCGAIGRRSIVMPSEPGQPGKVYTAPVLYVAEAPVLARKPKFGRRTFVGDLSQKDLARLRAVTRRAIGRPIGDVECDDIIEQIGPDAAFGAVLESLPTRGATAH